ncbi:MAG: hypothetical protein NC935_03210 [Candidatus Omnitrophica bacterium]|nr:hypothetical protein [Candidatus Omnitrophota bacterium]
MISFIIFSFFLQSPAYSKDFILVPVAIQISSKISDGKYSIEEITKILHKNNFKVGIIADRDLLKWEYGIWPLRNIFKKVIKFNSILEFGPKRYLEEIQKINNLYPDLILIAGFESAPFYYWEGSFFKNNLKLIGWHRHIITFGLENPQDYYNLPVIGNTKALQKKFKIKDILKFWPILIFFFALSIKNRLLKISLIIFSLMFFLNNYPFIELLFTPYSKNLELFAYQNFIDYANKKGAITIWAHPEAENIQKIGNILVKTTEYTNLLFLTKNYTGFAIFYEGYNKVGKIGGLWDDLLKEYLEKKRKTPIWAFSTLGFDYFGNLEEYLQETKNMVWIEKLEKNVVLDALKRGRFYCIKGKGSQNFILEEFSIEDKDGRKAIVGEEIFLNSAPIIRIKTKFLSDNKFPFKIKLIRNGTVIKIWETDNSSDIEYQEDYKIKNCYYRLEIESKDLLLVTNPIFVDFKL